MSSSTWEKGEPSALVPLSTGTRLSVSIVGPDRIPNTPLVIIVPGVTCSITEWAVVRTLLRPTVRVLLYERSGMGASDECPDPPTATQIAQELSALLQTLRVAPPYVIVCHSYGGIITRELLESKLKRESERDDVVGVVFVDATQEKSVALWPDSNLDAMTSDIDPYIGMGLDKDCALTQTEWDAFVAERSTAKHQRTARREMELFVECCGVLGAKRQFGREPPLLGDFPVSVVAGHPEIDSRRVFELAVEIGNGTAEQRRLGAEKLARFPAMHGAFQREMLSLSTKHRFVDVEGCGHFIHMVAPEAIVDEVNRVLRNC